MSGFARNTRRNPCSLPSSSSGVPGSVIATKCEPSGISDQNRAKCEFVSVVVPDLLAMTNSVERTSMARCTSRIWSGCVESRTIRSSAPSATPSVSRNTSGARDDPPMPHSTAVRRPSSWQARANARRSSRSSSRVTSSQPSRSEISAGTGRQTV